MAQQGSAALDQATSPTGKHPGTRGGGRPAGVMTQDYEAAADNLVAQMDTYNVTTAMIMPPPQYTGQPGACAKQIR